MAAFITDEPYFWDRNCIWPGLRMKNPRSSEEDELEVDSTGEDRNIELSRCFEYVPSLENQYVMIVYELVFE
jgi:hypothetical protein